MVIILVDLIIALKVKLEIPFEITLLIASVLPVTAWAGLEKRITKDCFLNIQEQQTDEASYNELPPQ